MHGRRLFFGCLMVFGLLVAGCAPAAPQTALDKPGDAAARPPATAAAAAPLLPSPSPKASSVEPRYGGILTRVMDADIDHYDVQQAQMANFSQVLFNVYQGLVRLHPLEHQKIVPELAEGWELSPDGKTYTFKFRKDIKWHDGKLLTMEDIKYSLERIQKPKEFKSISPRGEGLVAAMDTAEIVGADSVKVTTKYPSASFLRNIATGWVAIEPKHILTARGDMRRDAVGTGPFKLKEARPGVSVELAKNTDYFTKGTPYLDGLKFYVVRDGATRFSAFRTGQVHMTFVGAKGLSAVESEIVRRDMADKAVVYEHDSQTRFTVAFNMERKPWDDARLRRAVDLVFDRQAAIKVNGKGNIGSMFVAPWGTKLEEVGKLPGYRQPKDADVAEAKKLMAEAGFAAGLKTTLLARAAESTVRQGEVAKDQLAKIGIDAELVLVQQADIDDRFKRRAFDLFSYNFTDATGDPDETLYTYYATGGSRNYGGFSDKSTDELIQKQARTLDRAQREAILAQIETRNAELAPMVIIFWDLYQTGAWKQVKGFRPGPGPHPWGKFDQVWLTQ
ncbi:MAG: ABC transporter substrate-binding protein [Chloroflexi bacterium]|nr:ABC transporter substrate-binding protein [Chloroflexota bacterium]